MAEVIDANDLYPRPLSRPITVREAVVGVTPATMTDARVRWNSTYKANTTRRHWNRPFATLTTRNASNGVHPSEDRYFSIEETRRGAGFPDGFRFAGTAHQQAKQIGNCVPPPLMYAIAAQIRAVLFGGRPPERGRRVDYATLLDGLWQLHLAPRDADAPTVLSTFAGAGGSSLGYSMAGFRELLAVEWNGHAVETFRLNFPDVPVYHGDIAQLSADECLRLAGIAEGELDVFDGSPPCFPAGFSVLTDRGRIPIESCTAGMKVLTHTGQFKEVSHVFQRKYRGQLYTIETKYGQRPITSTPEHLFWARRQMELGAEPEWLAAKDLRAGDSVCSPYVMESTEPDVPMPDRASSGFVDEMGAWLPIKAINIADSDEIDVFNLEVEGDNSYTVEGIAVHNCQGFSTAGKRVLDDPRNQLFREYVRLLRGLQPRVFVMENVSGMVKGKMKLVFADALRELKAGGYVVSARLLNAKYFNVPQSRERLIFIGVREDIAHGRAAAGDEAEGEH